VKSFAARQARQHHHIWYYGSPANGERKFLEFFWLFSGKNLGRHHHWYQQLFSSRAAVTRHLDNMPECFNPGVATQ
jgi:hypothetical protein